MLIINILTDKTENFKGRFFKKQVRPVPFTRNSVTIRGKPCTIIEFNEKMLSTLNLEKLFSTFKGRILGSDAVVEKLVPIEYRFDFKPYYKRALLSSLLNNFDKTDNNLSLSIKDDDFVMSEEYKNISKNLKSLSLVAEENDETRKFSSFCFVEYGLFVRVSENNKSFDDDIYIDFYDMDITGKIIINNRGKEQLLYPDPKYFMLSDDLRPLLKYNIPSKLLCAAFESVV